MIDFDLTTGTIYRNFSKSQIRIRVWCRRRCATLHKLRQTRETRKRGRFHYRDNQKYIYLLEYLEWLMLLLQIYMLPIRLGDQ
jgi:hypothetical protein